MRDISITINGNLATTDLINGSSERSTIAYVRIIQNLRDAPETFFLIAVR
ncbi:hypothetical protein ASZ90_016380 [hydrocarbon metagenome]|uniref:Uncharacterized protein n=1 Tax=hydrocarbon metagenome TaxID=938273 RepID=A0A0W8EZ08_9ZZZZ